MSRPDIRALIMKLSGTQVVPIGDADGMPMDVLSCAVPTGAPLVGQAVIAVTGTAVQLSASTTPLPGGVVFVKSLSSNNAARATVGGSGVTNTVNGTGNGHILEPGDMVVVIAPTLSAVYVNGTAGDIFSFSAG